MLLEPFLVLLVVGITTLICSTRGKAFECDSKLVTSDDLLSASLSERTMKQCYEPKLPMVLGYVLNNKLCKTKDGLDDNVVRERKKPNSPTCWQACGIDYDGVQGRLSHSS